MTFREALDKHLLAIQRRDLQALADTVAEDELMLIKSDGGIVWSMREMLDLHREWFAAGHWTLNITPVQIFETPQMGVAVMHLVYRETNNHKPPVRQESYLTLVFREESGKWVMVLDQNTPVQQRAGSREG